MQSKIGRIAMVNETKAEFIERVEEIIKMNEDTIQELNSLSSSDYYWFISRGERDKLVYQNNLWCLAVKLVRDK